MYQTQGEATVIRENMNENRNQIKVNMNTIKKKRGIKFL